MYVQVYMYKCIYGCMYACIHAFDWQIFNYNSKIVAYILVLGFLVLFQYTIKVLYKGCETPCIYAHAINELLSVHAYN